MTEHPTLTLLSCVMAALIVNGCSRMAEKPSTPPAERPTYSEAKKQYHDTVHQIMNTIDTVHPGISWEPNEARGASGCEEPKFVSFNQDTAANARLSDEQRDRIVSLVGNLATLHGYGNHATIANTHNERYEAWYGKYDQELSVQFSPEVVIVGVSGGCFPDPEGAAFTNGPTTTSTSP